MKLLLLLYTGFLAATVAFQPVPAWKKTEIVKETAHYSPLFMASTTGGDSSSKKEDKCPIPIPSLPQWDPANWTPKRIWNSNIFRVGAILAVLIAARAEQASSIASTLNLSNKAGATIHLLSFGTWLGTVIYTTFVAGITMFKNLPRRTFGTLQSKLFPKYFQLCTLTILLQVSRKCHSVSSPRKYHFYKGIQVPSSSLLSTHRF
jgi:hypothetical protein